MNKRGKKISAKGRPSGVDTSGLSAFFSDTKRTDALAFEELLKEPGPIALDIDRRLQRKVQLHGLDRLSGAERSVYLVSVLFGEVRNGGFHQYLYNTSGDSAGDVTDALKLLRAPREIVEVVAEALSLLPSAPSRDRAERHKQVDTVGEAVLLKWRTLEDQFFKMSDAFVEEFVRRHPQDFALDPLS
ncbi:MAG: DUF4375 domain-containing protein [Polyangiaceae bacterium]|nr:DUF4375 domain-containing protein [Polyangiaceae bacterium]